ncbi:DUF2891 family protein [Cryobacterium roopkundense]|uniref:DUF2891 domain-containing protein n=1 Tax=Cryobacterium roopkundense TaxID=1001240 RepID=A0A7W8ZZ93_9MICO|nr:DUF2891 family protein [Cryobacterium roopkundense]MBB5642852.1 hypothetical protein [Cryobacterium roopkundense]
MNQTPTGRRDTVSQLHALAPTFADIVLENLSRPFPYSAHHTARSALDSAVPEQLHPAFFTSYDWHSCVHMHVLGVMLLEHGLDVDRDTALRAAIDENLTPEKLRAEAAYLRANPGWERPYGWAWLVRLAAACASASDARTRAWAVALGPLVDAVSELFRGWAATAEHPVRHGVHTNSAFGLALMVDAFQTLGRADAARTAQALALTWFGADTDWPGEWELSGQDFLSAGLSEADLMRRVLSPQQFAVWFARFLPGLRADSRILRPMRVTDETDGSLVHLHGLNLSRAGQIARILGALGHAGEPAPGIRSDAQSAPLSRALDPLLQAGLAGALSPDFMSTHWLATFAWDSLLSISALHERSS